MFRRAFDVAQPVRKAELTVAGFGYCAAEINGAPISDAVIDPPPSQFEKSVFSRTTDVTAMLRPGKNVVAAMLGRSYISGIAGPGAPWVSEPRLLAQLDMTFEDGTAQTLVTDANWKMADGPIHDWMYFGEDYDARVANPEWSSPDLDDARWRPALIQKAPTERIIPARAPAVIITDTFAAVESKKLSAAKTLYNFGKITAGWTRITVRGRPGTKLQICYGQQLNKDGTVYLSVPWGTDDHKLRQHVDHYVLKGDGVESWEPRFTRHGFQYAQVEILDGELDEFAIEARECHTPAASTGEFSCSNPLINKLHENQRRSLLLNHWGFPTDTSWRDRQGWTADTALFMDSAILNFASLADVHIDWLQSLRGTQQADGSIAAFAPQTYGFPAFNDPSWGGMIVMIPWSLYQHFGDEAVLMENYPAMARWMDLMDGKIAATGDLYDGFSFGDHGPVGAENSGTFDISNIEGPDLTRNAHLFQEARTLAQIARLLRKTADARRYDAMADRILPAFNAAYFDLAANIYCTPKKVGYRQTSNLMPLALGMVPKGHEAAVFANLVADIEKRGPALNTGAIGTKLILPTLTKFGRPDLAYALLTRTEYPSWGYWVSQGATSSWEVWSVKGLEQTLDHPFLGTFDEWLYQHLAGIQAAAPGYRNVRIAPFFPQGLEHVSASIKTPRGTIASSWRRDGQRIRLKLRLPEGGSSEVVLPFAAGRVSATTSKIRPFRETAGQSVFAIDAGEHEIVVS
ncbi:family 78 glycoside hydrolase catalytic domain [Sphingobium tyrosinilyticum]|uniref:alpha-L-rhamnosidase n=1 Tax=Sphingobium tyrosinilyticum TaxID=2715436 RepID=A0ABV9F3A7_9SPHN